MNDWPDPDEKPKPPSPEFIQDPDNPYVKYPKDRVVTQKQTISPVGDTFKPWPDLGLTKALKELNVDNLVEAVNRQRMSFKK